MSLKSDTHVIAIVGINQETASLFPLLLDTRGVNLVRIINPEREDLEALRQYPDIDVVIDTTNDPCVGQKLRDLQLANADVVGALSARIFFLTGKQEILRGGTPADREAVLASLHEIRQAILLSKNKEELLKLILNVAIRSVGADGGSIMLLDSEKQYLKIEIADGISPEILTSTAQKVGKGVAGKVVRTGKPVLIKGSMEQRAGGEGQRRKLVSSMCCPLVIGSEPVGALSVNSITPSKEFSESDLHFIRQLADFTADIIRTSKDFERSAQSTFMLSLLDSARTILNLSYPFDERLNLLLLRIVNSLAADVCNYYIFSREENSFLLKTSSSFKFELIRGKRLKFNAHLTRQVLESQDTICVNVVDKADGRRKWYIAHPVKIEGELVGLLFVHIVSQRTEMVRETETIRKIGDMLAAEQSNNMQLEASRIKTEKLSAITEASYDLASARTLNELAQVVVSVACLVLEAQSCVLRIKGRARGALDILDSFSMGSSLQYREIQKMDEKVAADAFESSRMLVLAGKNALAKYDAQGLVRSALSMCLQSNGRKFGTLSLYDKTSSDLSGPSEFTASDRDIFLNVCLQTSKALERFIH